MQFDSAWLAGCTPGSLTPRYDANYEIRQLKNVPSFNFVLKKNVLSLGDLLYYIHSNMYLKASQRNNNCKTSDQNRLRGMMHTAEFFFQFEYLGEIETKFENIVNEYTRCCGFISIHPTCIGPNCKLFF